MTFRFFLSRASCAIAVASCSLGFGPVVAADAAPTPLAIVTPALGPDMSNDPIAHYRIYEAAIARGDTLAAAQAAVLAWQTGERVWNGTNPNLPGLAFNAAWSLGLAGKIGEAREPARRAVAFAVGSPDKVNAKEAAFLLAYANMMVAPTKSTVELLNVTARALDGGDWSDSLLARGYLDGARTALNVRSSRLARELIDRGQAETRRIMPENVGMITNFLILRTQTSLQSRNYGKAVIEVMEARRSYGAPKSERDLNWAALAAWEAASRAVYLSVYGSNDQGRTGSRLAREDRPKEWTAEEKRALYSGPAECADIDLQRAGSSGPTGVSFPRNEVNDGLVGGALVRARLDETGRVTSTDILASLPRPSFGAAAVAGIQNWRYDLPAGLPVQCRFVNVTLLYAFSNY